MRIAREGWPFIIGALVVLVVLAVAQLGALRDVVVAGLRPLPTRRPRAPSHRPSDVVPRRAAET